MVVLSYLWFTIIWRFLVPEGDRTFVSHKFGRPTVETVHRVSPFILSCSFVPFLHEFCCNTQIDCSKASRLMLFRMGRSHPLMVKMVQRRRRVRHENDVGKENWLRRDVWYVNPEGLSWEDVHRPLHDYWLLLFYRIPVGLYQRQTSVWREYLNQSSCVRWCSFRAQSAKRKISQVYYLYANGSSLMSSSKSHTTRGKCMSNSMAQDCIGTTSYLFGKKPRNHLSMNDAPSSLSATMF